MRYHSQRILGDIELSNKENIEKFFEFVESRLARLELMSLDPQDAPLRFLMVYTFIDAMSAILYPDEKSNRSRFVKIIDEFGHWEYSDSVSWPHLSRLLELTDDPRFEAAKNLYSGVPKYYRDGEFRNLEGDPTISDVLKVWPLGENANVARKVSLSSIRHVELMYASRNRLVHQHREPGNGWDVSGKKSHPFYRGWLAESDDKIELVYPIKFCFILSDRIVLNMKIKYVEEDANPYQHFGDGSYYIDNLNVL